jgi:PadR family transcriptional regulator, regulatory protein PadR
MCTNSPFQWRHARRSTLQNTLPCKTHYLVLPCSHETESIGLERAVALVRAGEWSSQIRRGTLELCVLALIDSKPRYGYDLVTALEQWKPLAAKEGTVYPLLRRLQREGKVEGSWQESVAGPPRKYYQLTPNGRDLLGRMAADWVELNEAVQQTLPAEEARSHG